MREENESESSYMKRSFKEVVDEEGLDRVEDQLKEEGYKVENIRPRKSERRQELKKQQKFTPVKGTSSALPAEAIVENLPWPVDVNGHVDGAFVAGMRYEALNVIRGIRLAQELTKMGIDQATPVIRMAQEMRAAEGKAADEAAMKAAAGVGAQIMPEVAALRTLIGSQGENPMASMMMTLMMPSMQQAAQKLAGLFGATQPGATGQPQPGGEQPGAWSPPNIEEHSISEWED
ncbi:hypothetical protein ES707_13073 [subsurface metagenome]